MTDVTTENLDSLVAGGGIVLLDFWAAWCGPCRAFAPVFAAASQEHSDVAFGRVDVEEQPALAAGFGISSIPTLVAFRDGIIVYSKPGALRTVGLQRVIDQVQGLDMDRVRAEIAVEKKGGAS